MQSQGAARQPQHDVGKVGQEDVHGLARIESLRPDRCDTQGQKRRCDVRLIAGIGIGRQNRQECAAAIAGFLGQLPPRARLCGRRSLVAIVPIDDAARNAVDKAGPRMAIFADHHQLQIHGQRDNRRPIARFDDVIGIDLGAIGHNAMVGANLQPTILEGDLAAEHAPGPRRALAVFIRHWPSR